MEFAFMIELLPEHRSMLGIEFKHQQVRIELEELHGEQERTAYTFTLGLGLAHIQFTVFRKNS
jgi:hypothetical protein